MSGHGECQADIGQERGYMIKGRDTEALGIVSGPVQEYSKREGSSSKILVQHNMEKAMAGEFRSPSELYL